MNEISHRMIELALNEDLSDIGDLTSLYFVDPEHRSVGKVVSRESAVVSGIEVAEEVCRKVDPNLHCNVIRRNGSAVERGDVVLEICGPTQSILTAERTALNFLQRLSGVATVRRSFVSLISHTTARLLDTRKTTPGFRELEKQAVQDGGGTNHRIGLYDAVMVKDNHLAANLRPVELKDRIAAVRADHPDIKIEVEADRLDQVADFLEVDGIDVILLDNMNLDQLREAVAVRDQKGKNMELRPAIRRTHSSPLA